MKENMRLLVKNRLTWIVFLTIELILLFCVFRNIYISYSEFDKFIYEGTLYKKPFAIDAISRFNDDFSAIILLITPICFVFSVYKNDSFERIIAIRNNDFKQKLSFVFSFAFLTTVVFLVGYLISYMTYYFALDSKMNPYMLQAYTNGEEYQRSVFGVNNIMFKNLFWINNGNSTYLYFIVHGLIYSIVYFSFILAVASLVINVRNSYRVISYVLLVYIIMFINSFLFDNVFKSIVQMPGLFSIYTNEKYVRNSYIVQPIICFTIFALSFVINKVKKLINYKERSAL